MLIRPPCLAVAFICKQVVEFKSVYCQFLTANHPGKEDVNVKTMGSKIVEV